MRPQFISYLKILLFSILLYTNSKMSPLLTSVAKNKQKKTSFILGLAPYRTLTFLIRCLISLGTAILMLRRLYTVDDEDKKLKKKKNAQKNQTIKTISSIMKSNVQ